MITDLRGAELAAAVYDEAVPAFAARGDVKVAITEESGVRALAWRGTDPRDWNDIVRDLALIDFARAEHPELGLVHGGFVAGVESVLPTIEEQLAALPALPLVLTGHSLGAAMALIAGALLTLRGAAVARLVTFGSPRPGAERLMQILAWTPGVDYRHGGDPVTGVPCGFGFRHPRGLVQLGYSGLINITDHRIARYRDALTPRSTPS